MKILCMKKMQQNMHMHFSSEFCENRPLPKEIYTRSANGLYVNERNRGTHLL